VSLALEFRLTTEVDFIIGNDHFASRLILIHVQFFKVNENAITILNKIQNTVTHIKLTLNTETYNTHQLLTQ